ncbi:PRC-barrel domain-containing protein [Rhodococcus sp. NPDC058521]|uniref:PRC-barrel domain-containing protein n=1 Tax=Rhodococcus sp. NPDC058521 TaxID=3346536 RepID=UPI00366302C5
MTVDQQPTLIDLDDADLLLENPTDDIRGRNVFDRHGDEIGHIDGLVVDEDEKKVRFVRIGSGGFLGFGETKRLIPVDAITRIADNEVHIDRTKEHVADSSPYDPNVLKTADFYKHLYRHYGYGTFWSPGYVYPYPPML